MLSAYMSIARSVAEDLRHIPEGGLCQSRLRIAYNAQRRADLGKGGSHCSRAESVQKAIKALQGRPDDVFEFDEDYFSY
jgi:hypothetical protein